MGIIKSTEQLKVRYLWFFAALFQVAKEILLESGHKAPIAAYWRSYLQEGSNREDFFNRATARQVGI
jgi:hypothetical protein